MSSARKCLFCDKTAGSKEHVIAEWLSKAMDRRDDAITRKNTENGEIIREFPPIKFKHFVCKQVCHDCNTGWMSNLENDFKKHFESLVVPRSFDEGEIVHTLMKNNWDTLVRWLLKTAIVCDASGGKKEINIIPKELYNTENLNLKDFDLHVFAGEIMENNVGFETTTQIRKMSFSRQPIYLDIKGAFTFITQLNTLGLALVYCPSHIPSMTSHLNIAGRQVFPIIPSAEVNWGMPVMHHFFTIRMLQESVEVMSKDAIKNYS